MFINDANLLSLSLNVEGIYHCENFVKSQQVTKIICSGEVIEDIVFVDTNKGFAVQVCRDISGNILTINGNDVSHRIIYGDFEVVLKEVISQ